MASIIQRAFAGGEIGPPLYARCDEIKYTTGARKMRNFMIMKHGGVTNRPGTQFICEPMDPNPSALVRSPPIRLIPFEFSVDETYVLEMGNQYIAVIKNDQYISVDSYVNVTNITSSGGETTVFTGGAGTWDPSFNGFTKFLKNIVGMVELNGVQFVTYASTNSSFKIKYLSGVPIDSSGFTPYVSGGRMFEKYVIYTPYLTADLPLIKFIQSNDVITFTHTSYPVYELKRLADDSWFMNGASFSPSITGPTISSITPGGANQGLSNSYTLTQTSSVTGEESTRGNTLTITNNANSTVPNTINFGGMDVGNTCNIYKLVGGGNGTYGFIGTASTTPFVDVGVTPNLNLAPPVPKEPFSTSNGGSPGCCAYIQQRLTFGNQLNKPEQVNMSKSGQYHNFSTSLPSQSDDAIQFNLAGRKVNPIKHIVDLGGMVLFTSTGEFVVNGNGEGAITPSNIVPTQQSYYGSSDLRPIVIGQSALFVQARGSIVRDLGFQFQTQGYQGDDLSLFSPHLFEKHTMVDWDYQQIPNSIVWVARDDGVLLGLTYIKEQQIWGWHRHDFQNDFQSGFVENVCSIPRGNEDSIYLTIRRTINGVTKRYIEKIVTRQIVDIVDSVFTDSTITYDGRNNTPSKLITLTGTAWNSEDTITATASTAMFKSTDVGNQIQLVSNGVKIRMTISAYVSPTVVQGFPNKTVPVAMQSVGISTWSLAIKKMGGMGHLEGQTVSVFADGFVVASPNNSSYSTKYVVTNGTLTFDKPYAVIHVGLPFVSDLETLDIDMPNPTAPITTVVKRVSQVSAQVMDSRGFFAGTKDPGEDYANTGNDPLYNLFEYKAREYETYENPVALRTDTIKVNVASNYNTNGRVFVRQVDPIPLTILSIIPSGDLPTGGR